MQQLSNQVLTFTKIALILVLKVNDFTLFFCPESWYSSIISMSLNLVRYGCIVV